MDVDELMKTTDSLPRDLAESVRRVVRKSIPQALEQVKWGNPVYTVKGSNVVCIMLYRDHVNLGFFQGSKLTSKRLEGTGKGLRHIKVRSKSDIDPKEFARLLRKATRMANPSKPGE